MIYFFFLTSYTQLYFYKNGNIPICVYHTFCMVCAYIFFLQKYFVSQHFRDVQHISHFFFLEIFVFSVTLVHFLFFLSVFYPIRLKFFLFKEAFVQFFFLFFFWILLTFSDCVVNAIFSSFLVFLLHCNFQAKDKFVVVIDGVRKRAAC